MTNHVFEVAPSGRSKCRGCGRAIDKSSVRFGERMPNPFGEGDMTHWHHPPCAAHRRPEVLTEALAELEYQEDDRNVLLAAASHALAHHRLQRLGVPERAPSGRARCRACRELIEQDAWRLPLVFFEEGAYNGSGYLHATCAIGYCETTEVWDTIRCFAAHLDAADLADLQESLNR